MSAPRFVQPGGDSAPALWHAGSSPTGVLVLPGLDEPRPGHNYCWSELARALVDAGVACLRPTLPGSADDRGRQDVGAWLRTVEGSLDFLHEQVDDVIVVSRGAGSALVESPDRARWHLAVRPVTSERLERLLRAAGRDGVVRGGSAVHLGLADVVDDLGAESRCIGSLAWGGALLRDLAGRARLCAPADDVWFVRQPPPLSIRDRSALVAHVVALATATSEGRRHVEHI